MLGVNEVVVDIMVVGVVVGEVKGVTGVVVV